MLFSNRLTFKPMELKIQQLKGLYEEDFPKDCPHTFEHILEYKPWLKDKT